METNRNSDKKYFDNLPQRLKKRLSLRAYVDTDAAVESIKVGQTFHGPNVYILAFAIIIASIGLNVNSIPVIIGAMLISPLMGPIVGVGLSVGINDFRLLKSSLKNLSAMVVISILSSTLYFLLSPLKLENPTELLARTNPTIYDVLIALFGGLAGILEISRKEKGTVMSGVAIATALMPPLCTIGFGVATQNLHYAMGALYLFFINSVFIALAALVGVKYLGYRPVRVIDPALRRKNSRRIGLVVVIMVVPSVFSAITVVKNNNFERHANAFVAGLRQLNGQLVYDYKVRHENGGSMVELYVADEELDVSDKETIYTVAAAQGIGRDRVVLNNDLGGGGLRTNKLASEVLARSEAQAARKDTLIAQLQRELASYKSEEYPYAQLIDEIKAQYPHVDDVAVTKGIRVSALGEEPVVIVTTTPVLSKGDGGRLVNWLKVRMGVECEVVVR